MSTRRLLCASLPILCAAGCGTMDSVHVRVMRPAPVDLGQHDVVAIDHFAGKAGHELSVGIAKALGNSANPLTGQVEFEVIHRDDVDAMLEAMRRLRGQEWDQQSMGLLEKWRKARVVIKGDVKDHSVSEGIREEHWIDPEGRPHVTLTRQCAAHLDVVLEATDVEDNRVLDSVLFQEVARTTTRATDGEPPAIDHRALLDAARQQVIAKYVRRMVPHEDVVAVPLFSDGDLPALQVGNGYAKTGAWDRALESYRSALAAAVGDLAELRYMALFNVGVALQYTDRFDEARSTLQEAYALEQDPVILRQLQSLDHREEEHARLAEQARPRTAEPAR